MTLTVGSLFSGIGGIDIAFQQAGFDIVWQVENNEYCQKVLQKNFVDVALYGDIHDCSNLPHVDVITAGFPCQPFSIAGKRQGADDERFLIPEMLRVIKEVEPNVVFLENVPNFAKLNDGSEFRHLLEWFAENGYDAQWQHIRASDIGAPHQRERWFCVAYKLGNTDSQRRERHGSVREQIPFTRLRKTSPTRPSEGKRQTQNVLSQSRLGRTPNGVSSGLDGHSFPAGRKREQYDWEKPRTTERRNFRRDRIIALGNAVVPQTVHPTALEIYKWLER